MTHTEVDDMERGVLVHLLNVDIASKLKPSEIDIHAGNYALKLDRQAAEGIISDQQHRDGFEVIARIVSWSAGELQKNGNTIQLADLDPENDERHADIDATAIEFLSSFHDANLEVDSNNVLSSASYVQQRKDKSFYYITVDRVSSENQKIEYYLSVQELNDDNAMEVLNGFTPGTKEIIDLLLRRERIDEISPKTMGKVITGLAMS